LAQSGGEDVVPVVLCAEEQTYLRHELRNFAVCLVKGQPDLVERGLKPSRELVGSGAQVREAHLGQGTHHAETGGKVVGSVVEAGKEVRVEIDVMRHGVCRETITNLALG
jgi:hypothetical protein